jgi:effector-binding domain-containing protein
VPIYSSVTPIRIPTMNTPRTLALLVLLAPMACQFPAGTTDLSTQPGGSAAGFEQVHRFQPDLPLSVAPFSEVHATWKQRIDQPYVFVEFTGSYTGTGRMLPKVHEAMASRGLEPAGPPFALFYDDPGRVPVEQLRSRACVPVGGRVDTGSALSFDVLPSTTVVYAFAVGPYPEVPRAYPGLYAFMEAGGWVESGPIRETYLISPAEVASFDELVTEIQIPVAYGR